MLREDQEISLHTVFGVSTIPRTTCACKKGSRIENSNLVKEKTVLLLDIKTYYARRTMVYTGVRKRMLLNKRLENNSKVQQIVTLTIIEFAGYY